MRGCCVLITAETWFCVTSHQHSSTHCRNLASQCQHLLIMEGNLLEGCLLPDLSVCAERLIWAPRQSTAGMIFLDISVPFTGKVKSNSDARVVCELDTTVCLLWRATSLIATSRVCFYCVGMPLDGAQMQGRAMSFWFCIKGCLCEYHDSSQAFPGTPLLPQSMKRQTSQIPSPPAWPLVR